jgi:hypothetical protein
MTVVNGAGKTMPSGDEMRKSLGEADAVGEDTGLLQGGGGDLPLDYTERVQSFFPECKNVG